MTSNDLIVADARVSAIHVVLYLDHAGPVLLVLGRNPTMLNDQKITGRVHVDAGDRVSLPGLSFTLEAPTAVSVHRVAWSVMRADGRRLGVNRREYAIGGGREDNVVIPGLPPSAVTLHAAQQCLLLEVRIPAALDGERISPNSLHQLRPGGCLTVGDENLQFWCDRPVASADTDIALDSLLPREVRLAFRHSGATLSLGFPGGASVYVELTEIRAGLIAALLDPPSGLKAGELIPDDLLLPRVWPRQQGKGRTDVNILIYRVRKDLLAAGLNAYRILERARAGNATRLALAPNAEVQIHV